MAAVIDNKRIRVLQVPIVIAVFLTAMLFLTAGPVSASRVTGISPFSAVLELNYSGRCSVFVTTGGALVRNLSFVSPSDNTIAGLAGDSTYTLDISCSDGSAHNSESIGFDTPSSSIMLAPDGHFIVDGRPFFPLMQWLQAKSRIPYQSRLGINTFIGQGNGESAKDYLDECSANHVWGVPRFDPSVSGHSALLGWYWNDEPDLPGNDPSFPKMLPSELMQKYNEIRASDSGHPFFLTLTANFFSRFNPEDWMNGTKSWYYYYSNTADVVGFDYYMIYGWCKPEWIHEISDSQDEFMAFTGKKSTYQWIECAKTSSQWCTGRGVYDYELRNEVWQAIIHGAKAIGYFTHSWECPGYTQFCLSPELETELNRTNRQITDLTYPLLEGEQAGISVSTDKQAGSIDLMSMRFNSTVYIFAVNTLREQVNADFKDIPVSADNAVAEVYEESRNLPITDGSFSDSFSQLAVHVYKIGGSNSSTVYCDADADKDGTVSNEEMKALIEDWYEGKSSLAQLLSGIDCWKHGSG